MDLINPFLDGRRPQTRLDHEFEREYHVEICCRGFIASSEPLVLREVLVDLKGAKSLGLCRAAL